MAESELSWKERDHMYKLCVIPLLIVLYAFMAYLVYLMRTNIMKTTWDIAVWWALPLSIIESSVLFLTFEILYNRKVRKAAMFHMKRFARRMLLVNAGMSSFFATTIISSITLSETVGESNATFLGIGVWVLMLLIVTLKLRSRHLRKILEQT